ncbi:MAG TPA: methyl-accepting chemotaxis protein [Noviherbaspirillum sp.]|jgi:methyl-accepting chemotaxis protein|uniref:methyl-accepting chemotaxis protein n=1 Tax=Noviherbaspirillum sp. TaxID=1926288 RepID=UPI002F958515
MLNNLAIKWKLAALTAILLLSLAAVGLAGYVGVTRVGANMDEIGEVRLPSVEGLLALGEAHARIQAATIGTAIHQNNYEAKALFSEVAQQRKAAWAAADAGWKRYEPLPQTPEETVMWKAFLTDWDAWKRADKDLGATIDALVLSDSVQTQTELFEQFYKQHAAAVPLAASAEKSLEKIVRLNKDIAAQSVNHGHRALSRAIALMLGVGVAALLVSVLCSAYIARSITVPVGEAVRIAQTVAAGDLGSRIEVRTTEETGQLLLALKTMNDSLVKIVGEVRAGTDLIATASRQIASGNQDLSSRTEEQAGSLEETASSMEELASTVRQNAENARQANALAVAASGIAEKGGSVVSQVVDTMDEINASSGKIAAIISVIDGIAFQTNILALNAAVEAARAGEQGRGFAVVATEVRSLAQRSASAAREIKALIGDSVEKVENGSRLVKDAGATMHDIVASVRRVTDIMAEIAAASQEQTAGIEQINRAVSAMDQATQQNASLVEEAAAASGAMQDQAANLARTVSVFRLESVRV